MKHKALDEARRAAQQDMLTVARGCVDYSGGFEGTHYNAYLAGIQTVVSALTASIRRDGGGFQIAALRMVGRSERAKEMTS